MADTLTREEARERARLLSVRSYRVELDLTGDEETFRSVTTVRFTCASPGAATFIDLAAAGIHEVTLNSAPLPVDTGGRERIPLSGLRAENELRVVADCAYSRTGEGLHRFTDPADKEVYLYTDLEPFDAHRFFACFDQPDLKSTFEFTVTAPVSWIVLSNGPADVTGEPVPGSVPGSTAARWHFPPGALMSTYITAIIAGPYHGVRDSHDGIPLGVYCRRSLATYLDADEIFEVTRQGFDFYHQAFGTRYAFGKYDQVFVPEYKAGAMENAGCVTFLEDFIFRSRVTDFSRQSRASVILHEMAHMWFGDLVTMKWWDGLWLNESFATWASTHSQAEATRWRNAWTSFAQLEKAWAYKQDQLPSTHPIEAEIPDIQAVEVNFDGITYAKGASVLKQLVAYVGLDNFLAGLRRYFAEHAWGNATLADLLAPLAEASGRELSGWSKQWLETAGVNTLRPVYEVSSAGEFTRFAIRQEAPESHPVLRDHRIAIGLYDHTSAGLSRRARVECDIAGELTEVAELVGARQPDLVLVNDDDLTYAKIRLDERSLAAMHASIARFTDALPMALCWSAAWDMCRDAEFAARGYLRLALTGVPSVPEISMVQVVLRQAISTLTTFTDPAWREAGRAETAAALRRLLEGAAPGSDQQLAYAYAFSRVARSEDDLALLAGLLRGAREVPGLTVDTDLRWALLRRLVSTGVAGETDIEDEALRDLTDAGARHAAACRAAIPTAAAKAAAWELITSGELPNATFRATLGGFADPERPGLLKPFQQPYFDTLRRAWDTWSLDMAQWFVAAAYPQEVSPAVIAATDEFLAADDIPAALRRLVIENKDGVRRALRCQECDRKAGEAESGRVTHEG